MKMNAALIQQRLSQEQRIMALNATAIAQMRSLLQSSVIKKQMNSNI